MVKKIKNVKCARLGGTGAGCPTRDHPSPAAGTIGVPLWGMRWSSRSTVEPRWPARTHPPWAPGRNERPSPCPSCRFNSSNWSRSLLTVNNNIDRGHDVFSFWPCHQMGSIHFCSPGFYVVFSQVKKKSTETAQVVFIGCNVFLKECFHSE